MNPPSVRHRFWNISICLAAAAALLALLAALNHPARAQSGQIVGAVGYAGGLGDHNWIVCAHADLNGPPGACYQVNHPQTVYTLEVSNGNWYVWAAYDANDSNESGGDPYTWYAAGWGSPQTVVVSDNVVGGIDLTVFTGDCVVQTTADDGPGSLRQCLSNVEVGSTVTFSSTVFPPTAPVSVQLSSALWPIRVDGVTVDAGGAGVILDGSGVGLDVQIQWFDDISLRVNGQERLLNGDFAAGLSHWRPWDGGSDFHTRSLDCCEKIGQKASIDNRTGYGKLKSRSLDRSLFRQGRKKCWSVGWRGQTRVSYLKRSYCRNSYQIM